MPIQPKAGHWYETRGGEIAKYDGPTPGSGWKAFPHIVGGLYYTDAGRYHARDETDLRDLLKDLGTTDPRKPKKPRKAPAKVRKVRMWLVGAFPGDDGDWFYVRATKKCAGELREGMVTAGIDCGPIFSQVIEVPVPVKKKA